MRRAMEWFIFGHSCLNATSVELNAENIATHVSWLRLVPEMNINVDSYNEYDNVKNFPDIEMQNMDDKRLCSHKTKSLWHKDYVFLLILLHQGECNVVIVKVYLLS